MFLAGGVCPLAPHDASDGPSVCVLVNRSLSESRCASIPSRGERAVDLIGGMELRREGEAVSFTLPPLGSAVIYFDDEKTLARPMDAGCGVVCHVTSIPNGDKPGTLGAPARAFVDWLASCGQRYWQILPVNPTDMYGSPYAGSSVFAGNERLLEPDGDELRRRFEAFEPDAAFREFVQINNDWLEPYCHRRGAWHGGVADLAGGAAPLYAGARG